MLGVGDFLNITGTIDRLMLMFMKNVLCESSLNDSCREIALRRAFGFRETWNFV